LHRVLIESHSTRSEAAGDELDGPTLAKMFRAEARAATAIQKSPEKYAHHVVEEAGGLIDLKDLKLSRFLNAPPAPYTRERFRRQLSMDARLGSRFAWRNLREHS